MLSLKLLGNVELFHNGARLQEFRSQKELALLIYLAQTGQAHRRDAIAELLWDSRSTKQALSNVRTTLTRLQKQVGDLLIVTNRSLAFLPELRQQVDSVVLQQALATIAQISSAEHAMALQQALELYRGDFLADFQLRNTPRFDEWVATTRESIRAEVLSAYYKLGQYILTTDDSEQGIAIARRWVQLDALDEDAHTLLIQMLLKSGRSREALSQYEQCTALLRAELGVEPSAAMTALIKSVRPSQDSRPRPGAAVRHNIPTTHNQFFGRNRIQQEIHQRLNQPWCRLISIVGTGGVGKTRLASTIAQSRLNHYPDGVWFVELADLDPQDDHLAESIAVEIATALDLRFVGPATPIEQLLNRLQHKQILLVLDNFEHLLEGFQIVLDIVRRCEYVQLLITSREALQLQVEWTLTLDGLSYPSSDSDDTPTEALALFLARQAQQRWDEISADDLAAIHTICRAVEGLPLAIELAAALTRHTTPQAIIERLQHSFDTLATSLRDVPQRHHSLQIVFEMSWRSLTPTQQQRLAQLSVFRGGFSAHAAQQIAGANVRQLAALGEKSLVSRHTEVDRYTLHPIIRAYAATKLPTSDQTQPQHARYYLALLAQHTELLQRNRPQESIAVLEPEIDNLRLAWQTGLEQHQGDLLATALTSLSSYYQLRGLAQEGEAVMHTTAAIAATWGSTGLRLATRAGLEQARFQNRLGRYWPATLTIQTALKLANQNADRWAEGMGHVLWGESLWRLGEYKAASNKLTHALAIGEALGSDLIIGWCHHHLGIIDDIQGRYDSAQRSLQQACGAWQSLENANALSGSRNSIGLVYLHQGNLPAAQQAMEQALELCIQVDSRHTQALLLNNLSMVASRQGDHSTAQSYLQRGLALAVASGNLTGQGEIYTNLGRNYLLLLQTTLAAEHLEQGLRIAESLGNRSLIATTMLYLARTKREQGEETRAELLYQQSLQIARQDNLSHIACDLLIDLSEMLCDVDQPQARQYSAEALALADSIGNPQLRERADAIAKRFHLPAERNKQNLSA